METQEQIQKIIERNKRVELDKNWETSITRRAFIALVTYIIATWWMHSIGNDKPFLNAVVPTGGYLLSTLALPFLRRAWEKVSK